MGAKMPRHGGKAVSRSGSSMSRRFSIVSLFFYTALAAASACAAVLYLRPALADSAVLRSRRDQLVEENRKLEAELASYRTRHAELATNPEYIEKIARDQGLVAPTEMVFVFPEEP